VSARGRNETEKLARMTEEELAFELKRRAEALGLEITVKPRDRYTIRRPPDTEQPFDTQVPALAGGGIRYPNHD
jgi:hypothetical protein